jgi:hypothetical protein
MSDAKPIKPKTLKQIDGNGNVLKEVDEDGNVTTPVKPKSVEPKQEG